MTHLKIGDLILMIHVETIMITNKGVITVKTWNENEKDAFSYFQWFNKDEAFEMRGMIQKLTVFSVNASEVFGISEKNTFIDVCSSEIQKIFVKGNILKDYRLYLLANVEVKDRNSRIEKHKKVWRKVQSKWNLDEFNKGPEIEKEIEGKIFFSSIAQFSMGNFSTALQVISDNPKKYAIIASRKDNILSEEMIKNIFEIAFNKHSRRIDEIDYFALAIHLCYDGDIVFRWGDSSEQVEVAIVFSRDTFTVDEI